jgi:hypothetical protein
MKLLSHDNGGLLAKVRRTVTVRLLRYFRSKCDLNLTPSARWYRLRPRRVFEHLNVNLTIYFIFTTLPERLLTRPSSLKNDCLEYVDFGLPPSLQGEQKFTLWTARNEVTFGRRQHDGLSIRSLRQISVMLKAELRLHGRQQFTDHWPQGWRWRFQQNDVVFSF